MNMKGLVISEEVLKKANVTAQELREEIAVFLYAQKKFSLGQASDFLGITRLAFQKMLADRKIPIHYGVEDLHKDLETLKSLNL